MFSDDSKCFKTITNSSDYSLLQSDLISLFEYSLLNELNFQPPKCENLRVSRKRHSFNRDYLLNGVNLKVTDQQRDLGLLVSNDLTWTAHTRTVVSKANRILGFLKRHCLKYTKPGALRLLYYAIVRSQLGYASQVWAPQSNIGLLNLVESVQRRATKLIGDPKLSYKQRLISLKILPLSFWHECLDLIFFFKSLKGLVKLNVLDYVSPIKSQTRRGSSSGPLFSTNFAKTSLFRDSYFQRIVPLWNSLPVALRQCNTVNKFKRLLKNLFWNRLLNVFDVSDVRSWKIVCVKCRKVNVHIACNC